MLCEKNHPFNARTYWIATQSRMDRDDETGTLLFRKEFPLPGGIRKAIIRASALGCYDLYLNGQRVDDRYFAPGYTQYTRRVQYQTFDVSDRMKEGKIVLEAEVSGGWYAGRLGLVLDGNRYGMKRAFLLEMELTDEHGAVTVVSSDESWRAAASAARTRASFFDGEVYHAENENAEPAWEPVRLLAAAGETNSVRGVYPFDPDEWQCIPELTEDQGVPVLAHETIVPMVVRQTETETIFDVGRNLAGIVCIRNLDAAGGETLTIRHGEILDQGKVYTGNLRTAKAELVYTCKSGVQSWEPRFTYMGFRYFSVSSDRPLKLGNETFCVRELYSDMPVIGDFSCSDEMLNQLQRNIMTSQKANFIDIPTDCPQRDERCGWTGDITTFSSTAAYNMDCSRFLRRWLKDVNILQEDNGKGFAPYIIPDNTMGRKPGGEFWCDNEHNSVDAVWGDAAVVLPWNLYWSTGDRAILEDHYAGMKSQVDYVRRLLKDNEPELQLIFKKGIQLGDWLAPGEGIPENMKKAEWTSTAYWANSVQLVARTADILGREEEAETYRELFLAIRQAFHRRFIRDGHIVNGFQSIYALALCFDLLSKEERELAAEDLVQDIRARGNHLATGFVGTPYLLFALSDTGHMDTAYDLLFQDSYPSWLYPVKTGATSIWERWDSLKADGTINTAGDMVSFNHYSYGAVGDFLYRRVCGLEALEAGYSRFRIAPYPGRLAWAETRHISPHGEIAVRWELKDGIFKMNVTVPNGTTAEILLPDGTGGTFTAGRYQLACPFGGF